MDFNEVQKMPLYRILKHDFSSDLQLLKIINT
jgi:hypothetical protein